MLKKIEIANFRQFENFTLMPHNDFTLICGLNGTGKSTFIVALAKLQDFLQGNISASQLWSNDDIPAWLLADYGNLTCKFALNFSVDNVYYCYGLSIGRNFRDNICRIEHEILFRNNEPLYESSIGDAIVYTNDGKLRDFPIDWNYTGLEIAHRYNSHVRAFLQYYASNLAFISLNPFAIKSTHSASSPTLQIDGSNFSAWYDHWLDIAPDKLSNIFFEIKEFLPGFIRFALLPHGNGKCLIGKVEHDCRLIDMPFERFSDGQKALCIFYAILSLMPDNSTVFIDEFENFLSPVELQPLINAMNDVAEDRHIQFVLVSHMPSSINWFRDRAIQFDYTDGNIVVSKYEFNPEVHVNLVDSLKK